MRLRLGILALMVMLTACGSSAASSSRHCGPSGAKTLATSSQARVYSWHGGVYGCSFAGGRTFRLGSAARSIRESQVTLVALAGNDAAYGLSDFGVDTVRTGVVVRRLTDGKQLQDFPATNRNVAEGFQSVGSVAVTSGGAVAWIGTVRSIRGGQALIEVHSAAASASTSKLLDSGAGIVPTSLRLHGSTLTWKHGASTRHATLR